MNQITPTMAATSPCTYVQPPATTLTDLPTEIRLDIFTHVLDVSNVPTRYGYTGLRPMRDSTEPRRILRTHGLVAVNKELGAEYRQAFYERTEFFLRIHASNAFEGIPQLKAPPPPMNAEDQTKREEGEIAAREREREREGGIPNLWNAPDALIASLRHCIIYIELGEIKWHKDSSHSVKKLFPTVTPAHVVTHRFEVYDEDDVAWDAQLKAAVFKIVDMQQLRSVQLVWDNTIGDTLKTEKLAQWIWDSYGQPFVDALQKKRNLRSFQVRIGNRTDDMDLRGNRGEGDKWTIQVL
ncbi:hypothetical protein K504DRAFT_455696 [Pleomassaria siparia CBS 279.74]|uniref:F-box domain-containing protein n=1 Tax=Pleomassaria siparia CBS 279.74 TaxID=1314801 RepID=A0A6G1K895_9PLEO|nr:hypothetical protein K504DRAFT_455696 [Pleomassaria siparia CBS 279.74]